MGSRAKRMDRPGRKASATTDRGCADRGGLDGPQVGEDRDEGGDEADRGGEEERHEGSVAAGRDEGQYDGRDEDGGAGEEELEASDALVVGEGQQPGAGDGDIGQGAEAEGDGGAAVVVDTCAYAGDDDEEQAGDAGEDALEAVHVVADLGAPRHEREQRGQDAAGDESGGAGQVAVPQGAVAGDGGGDGLGHVVEDGGRQRLGERAQGEQLAVEDALRGEGAGAVEDGAVTAYEVVADGGALGGALLGEPQDLRVEVGDGYVVGECHVDTAVGCHDGDAAEAEPRARSGRGSGARLPGRAGRRGGRHAHLLFPPSSVVGRARSRVRVPPVKKSCVGCAAPSAPGADRAARAGARGTALDSNRCQMPGFSRADSQLLTRLPGTLPPVGAGGCQ
ncbi:hypothetical protein GCM10020256_18790 [Streptomyces thermocoprophilus]